MKTIAYCALHYGRDYLYYAIRSVIDYVDEFYILYSRAGSHGYRTDRPCPDTRSELIAEAKRAAGDKLRWIDGEWSHEGQQRDSIYGYAPDADVILVVDSDEVWGDGLAARAISLWSDPNQQPIARYVRLPIIHYWRSFYRCVIHDPAYPIRVIFTAHPGKTEGTLTGFPPISHFGYAQRAEIVEYKQHTHGHRGEWRRDVDWFNERFMANAQQDCHPVGSEYWNPEPVDPADYMPDFMRAHPYWSLPVIGEVQEVTT